MRPVETRSADRREFRPMLRFDPVRTPLDTVFPVLIACLLIVAIGLVSVACTGLLP